MNLIKLKVIFVFIAMFVFVPFIFCKNLDIESGKNLLFGWTNSEGTATVIDQGTETEATFTNPQTWPQWYNPGTVYGNINIGAGSKVILDDAWEYVYTSSETSTRYEYREVVTYDSSTVPISSSTHIVEDEYTENKYNYQLRERIATLSIASTGTLTLNNGSQLAIRNEYSLITSSGDVSLKYKDVNGVVVFDTASITTNAALNYVTRDENSVTTESTLNMKLDDTELNLFTGDIIFEVGDTDTILTFSDSSKKTTKGGIGEEIPTATHEWGITETVSGGKKSYKDIISAESIQTSGIDVVSMTNNFIIKSNRAVFDVELTTSKKEDLSGSYVTLKSSLSGDGMVVKKGKGTLSLIDAMSNGLTGKNTGFGLSIEEGSVLVSKQSNVGNSDIYIDSKGVLVIFDKSILGPTIINNDMTINSGAICVWESSDIILQGDLLAGNDSTANITLRCDSNLILSGKTNIENYKIEYGIDKGGYNNYLTTGVDGLATKTIIATNKTGEEYKDVAFFELVLDEDENKMYSGSLQGELYLRKTGAGLVVLSGENTYTKGTYITEGGLLLATSKSIGEGKIIFDGGVAHDTTTYSTIGVSSSTEFVEINNDIHIKKGAIFNVYENQILGLSGSIESVNPLDYTEVIKNGLGTAIILKSENGDRQSNISKFTITEGSFILDKGVILDSEFSLNGTKAFLSMNEGAGIKNNVINIENGDLIIFNEKNISSATAVNFNNLSVSTESFSKLEISSNAVISKPNFINIAKNIEFIIDATTTAKMNSFNFADPNVTIVKSGAGIFVADGEGAFTLENLYVNQGTLKLDNTNMTVSSKTIIDGGILKISSTSSFASIATSSENKKITILNGGIGIYDDNSVDSDTTLSFEGTDEQNLSKLIVESADIDLTNNIYVRTGVDIQNEKNLTFSGYSIEYDTTSAGIFAKSGKGTMIIDSTGTFNMGEIRALDGNLLIKSDINVSTVSIFGQKAILSFDNVSSATSKNININNGGLLSITTSTINVAKMDVLNSTMSLSNSNLNVIGMDISNSTMTLSNSNIRSAVIDVLNSTISLKDFNSNINAIDINIGENSLIYGIGNYNSTINMQKGSVMCIGENKTENILSSAYSKEKLSALSSSDKTLKIESLNAKNVVFEQGSSLKIDVKSEDEILSSDKLILSGDITVQKDVKLEVNLIGDTDEFETTKNFEFIIYSGSGIFANSSNEIFNILLKNSRLSASTFLEGKSIFLQIVQKFTSYDIPGLSTNQQSVTDLLNKIYGDSKVSNNLKATLEKMDSFYGIYVDTGDSTEFVNALQELSGIFYANSFMTSALLSNSKTNIVYNRLDKTIKENDLENNVWAQVYTNKFTVSKSKENPKFENNIYGIIAGYDNVCDENTIIGFSAFYGQGELKQLDDKANVVDVGANVYANYKATDKIDIKGLLGYSMQDYDTTRKLKFINNEEIKSKYAANTINVDLEASYKFVLNDKIFLRPIIGAECAVVSNGDIEEDGNAEQRLKIKENTYTKADAKIGIGLQSQTVSAFNWHLLAFAKQILIGEQFKTKACFSNVEKYEFEIESTKLPVTSIVGNIGCSYDINSAVSLSLDLNADTGSTTMFGGNIGATYRW